MAGPCLPIAGIEFKQAAGIPLTKKELKNRFGNCSDLKSSIKQLIRQKNNEECVNRYMWYNIPMALKSQEIERLLFQKGQLIFWYWKARDKFMLTPFALCEGLDEIGRYIYVNPIPMCDDSDPKYPIMKKLFSDIKLRVIYDVQLEEDYLKEDGTFDTEKMEDVVNNGAVIIYDRTPSISQNIVPRINMMDGIIDLESDILCYARTSLINSTGVTGMKVGNEDEQSSVSAANAMVNTASIEGLRYVPITGSVSLEALTTDHSTSSLEFLQSLEGINNFRLSMLGLENNGVWDKSQYVNETQSAVSNVGLTIQDGLQQRQDSCAIINSVWNCSIWSEVSESVSKVDMNMDGVDYETNTIDQHGSVMDGEDEEDV